MCSKKKVNEQLRQEYLRWKRKNVTLRGMRERYQENKGGARFGTGLYTAFLSNKKMAKEYGTVYFVLNAIPKNPKVVNDTNIAEIFIHNLINDWCKERELPYNPNEFFNQTDVRTEMLKKGYDGLVVRGREMVNYNPSEDVKYFENERQLEMYYDDFIAPKLNLNEGVKKYTMYNIQYFVEMLYEYKNKHTIPDLKLNDKYLIWVIQQMRGIIDELEKNNIKSDDFTNANNLGLKPNGNIGYFDIGYGDYFEDFNDTPKDIELDEASVGLKTNLIDKIIKKFTNKPYIKLGRGGYFGVAYDIGDNKIIKFTKDKTEAINSIKILGKNNNHLANVYDVKKYTQNENTIYVIVLEKLELTTKIFDAFLKINKHIIDTKTKHIDPKVIEIIKQKHPFVGQFLQYLCTYGYDKTWEKYGDKVNKYPQYDFNDISDIGNWIKDSKYNTNDVFDEPPMYIINKIKKFLF